MWDVDFAEMTRPSHVIDEIFSDDTDPCAGVDNHGRGDQRFAVGSDRDTGVISRILGEDNGKDGTGLGV